MAPNSKVAKAFKAMKDIGIPEETVKPVLKNLLDLYDKSWTLIEDENYRVLVDAIFDHEFPKREESRKQESRSEYEPEECEPPLKKYRLRNQKEKSSASPGDCSPGFNIAPSRMQGEAHVSQTCCELKVDLSPYLCLGEKKSETETVSSPQHCRSKEKRTSSFQCLKEQTRPSQHLSDNQRAESDLLSPPTHVINKGEVPVPLQLVQKAKRLNYERRGPHLFSSKEPKIMPGDDLSLEENVLDKHHNNALILMSETDDEDQPQFEVPLAIMPPGPPTLLYEDGSSDRNCSDFQGNGLELLESEHLDTEDNGDSASDSSQFDLASSLKGEVKISLICNSSGCSNFHSPSLDAVLKLVEEKHRKTYRITEPDFSPMKLMKDICECFLAEGTNCSDDGQVRSINISRSLAISKKFNAQDGVHARGNHQGDFCIPPSFPNVPFRFQNLIEVLPHIPRVLALDILHCIVGFNVNGNSYGESGKNVKALGGLGYSNLSSLVVAQKQSSHLDPLKALQYVDDITRGGENVKISLINEISDLCMPAFYYIPRNIVYQNAYVKFLLARISDENCCSNCFGDCRSLAIPCACAGETGGEFAYTLGGLVEDKFLEKCISMSRDPQHHHFFYCNDCPLERSSKGKRLSGQCKGHLVRKFIKECWYKCGCSNKCGNRVVQRGITVNLQVFMTSEGKGWGLRTLEDLPKGAFVCEYVGEIVTNMELFQRNTQMSGSDKHTYPVLLDADWGSEGVLKDEEALCLDATIYGNVARFINHRCFDANLVEIPVEVETPDHHYYHLAFFTTRKVDALEELTWDYGIDFKDHGHPVKAFHCCCGSNFCQDVARPKRKY